MEKGLYTRRFHNQWMNILIISRYNPKDIPGGGQEFAMDVFAKGLSEKGHKVSMVSYYMNDGKPLHESTEGYDAYRVRGTNLFFPPNLLGFIKVAKKVNPDIILVSSYAYSIYAKLISKIIGCKYGAFLHDRFDIYGPRFPFNISNNINRKFTKDVSVVIATSAQPTKLLLNENGQKSIVSYIGFDINIDSRKEIYRKYSTEGSPFKIINIGRMEKNKGVDYLLEAFIEFKKDYPNSECVFVGGGGYLSEFKEKCKGISNVRVTGFISKEEKLKEMLSSDVFVNPTYISEGIVLTNIECMKLGVPIIITDTGASTEAVKKDVDGLVIRPENKEDIIEALRCVANNPEDVEKRARNAMINSKRFDREHSINEIERIIHDAIQS